MKILQERAQSEMYHHAKLYEWAYSHLTSQIGPEVLNQLAESKLLSAAVRNVMAQRYTRNLEIGDALDLNSLGLTEDQLARAGEYRAERAGRLAEIKLANSHDQAGGPRGPLDHAQDVGRRRRTGGPGQHG